MILDEAMLFDTLRSLGFTRLQIRNLRRISRTLRNWYELECGNSNSDGSWAIERDGDGPPFLVHYQHVTVAGKDTVTRTRIPDRESGAKKRLARIIGACNQARLTREIRGQSAPEKELSCYLQTDPRGAALYILRPGDVPDGVHPSGCYTNGICVS